MIEDLNNIHLHKTAEEQRQFLKEHLPTTMRPVSSIKCKENPLRCIYVIHNTLNDKIYIGQTENLSYRIWKHQNESIHLRFGDRVKMYVDMNRQGTDTFTYGVLQKCSKEELYDLEKKYIKMFDATCEEWGYNQSCGGLVPCLRGNKSSKSVVDERLVFYIRELYANATPQKQAYEKVKDTININTFRDIWRGKTYKDIHYDVYTPENKRRVMEAGYKRRALERDTYTKQYVKRIRELKAQGLRRAEVYAQFNFINKNTFGDIWKGNVYKHITA